MGNLFGKKGGNGKPSNNVSQQDLAVLQLKQLRDKIKQTQKRVTIQMDKDKELAKKLISENKKDRALLLLKRKKRMEKSILDMDSKLEVLEKMVSDIEFSQIEVRLLDGLKAGNEALKTLNSLMSVEDIESILEETREAAQKQKEITQLLSSGKEWTEEDEDELQNELNALIAVEEVVELPSVPTEEPVVEQEEATAVEEEAKEKKTRRRKQEAIPAS